MKQQCAQSPTAAGISSQHRAIPSGTGGLARSTSTRSADHSTCTRRSLTQAPLLFRASPSSTKQTLTGKDNWCNANPVATLISIDAMTRKQDQDWLEHVELLRRFDLRTERYCHYLINGTGAIPRLTYLYDMLTPERVTVTDSNLGRPTTRLRRSTTSTRPTS